MQNKNLLTILFSVVGLGAVVGGIYTYYLKNLELLEDFRYRLAGFRILSSNVTNIRFEVDIDIINDADISVTITNYNFDVYLNGVKVGKINNANSNEVLKGRGGVSRFTMQGDIETFSFIGTGLISGLRENLKNSTIRFDGSYGLKKGLVKLKNLPMNESFKLKEFM